MRKVIGWYNLLIENDILDFSEEEVTETKAEENAEI
jgi:hypothetical protein